MENSTLGQVYQAFLKQKITLIRHWSISLQSVCTTTEWSLTEVVEHHVLQISGLWQLLWNTSLLRNCTHLSLQVVLLLTTWVVSHTYDIYLTYET